MNLLVALWMVLSGPASPELHKEYYDNGAVKATYVVEANTVTVLRYFPSGMLRERGTFSGTEKDGTWTSYSETGAVEGQAYYAEGQRTGTWSFWYNNGQLRSQTEYSNGKAIEHSIWNQEGIPLSYAD